MTKQYLIDKFNFVEIPHFTITDSVIFPLGSYRFLSAGCVGTLNEMLWICECDKNDDKNITDLVCLHNYDYDGYLTEEKVESLIKYIGDKNSY